MELPNCLIGITKLYMLLIIAKSLASADDNETSTSIYGTDWVLFPDDFGGLHFANLSFVSSVTDTIKRSVYFHLYTRRNPNDYEELFIDNDATSEYLEADDQTKFITHGWMSSGESDTVIDIKDAYLKNRSVNAIVVDWHEIADEMVYVVATTSTRYVGYKVAQMAAKLMDRHNVSADQLHFIGHSLGAHVMGFAGENMQKNNVTVARVTGLDPARPLFEMPPVGGLSSDAATFVDIIHTCGGILGYKHSHGHADFYPNRGTPAQPGCDGFAQLVDACSHGRSHMLFAESINSEKGFVSYPCANYDEYKTGNCQDNAALMGDPADSAIRGDYFLRTNQESSYARGADNGGDEEN